MLFGFQALGVFGLCQIYSFVEYLRSRLSHEQFNLLFKTLTLLVGGVAFGAAAIATALGSILLSKLKFAITE
jgi:dolichyl-diphosphooligosaccharide--protein glycosyltransferase